MNQTIFYFFYNFAHQNSFLERIVFFLAEFFPYLVVMLAGMFLLFHHEIFRAENPFQAFTQKYKEILAVFLSGIFAYIFAHFLKSVFDIARPFENISGVEAFGSAFPSGHASFFMALAVSIFLTHKKAGYVFMFFALLIGIARVAIGVHFPIDILGGFVLGASVSCGVKYLYPKFAYLVKSV